MNNHHDTIILQLSEQIALEESLCKLIEEQLGLIEGAQFDEARQVLKKTYQALENNFSALNKILDKFDIDKNNLGFNSKTNSSNGNKHQSKNSIEQEKIRVSKIIRDDFSALNLVAMSNTLLHTTALALNNSELAAMALKHLEKLAPLVVELGIILPKIVTEELALKLDDIDRAVTKTAQENAKKVWLRAVPK